MDVLRWLLVLPAAFAGWLLALGVGITLHTSAERLCPIDQIVSGKCMAAWFPATERVIFITSSAVAATLIVILSTWMAPTRRSTVAYVAFAGGAIAAIYMGITARAYWELVAALIAGAFTTRSAAR